MNIREYAHRKMQPVNQRHRIFLIGLLFCLVTMFCLLPQRAPAATPLLCQGNDILFVGSDRPLARIDEPLRLYLQALGQDVTVRSADEVREKDAKDKALIIISESVESRKISRKFRDTAVPLLTWEGWLQDDLAMTAAGNQLITAESRSPNDKDEGSYGERLGQRSIRITDHSHPLAAGYEGEVTTVTNRFNRFHWGVPGPNAIRIAEDIDDAEHTMLYAYEKGEMMVGQRAPARRVFLHNASGPSLTKEGLSLFLTATYWAMGCLDEAIPPTPTGTRSPTPTATNPTQPTSTPTATSQPTAQLLSVEKRDLLFHDADSNGQVSTGDILLYIITIENKSDNDIEELILQDQLDPNTLLRAGSVQSVAGTINSGNKEGDKDVVVKISELESEETIQISFQVEVLPTSTTHRLRNQAIVSIVEQGREPSGQQQYVSDDPDTPTTTGDATVTPLGSVLSRTIYLPWIAR